MRTPRGSPAGYGFRIGKGAFVGRAWTPQLLGIVAGTREAEGENRSVVPGRDRGRGSARIDTFLVTTHGRTRIFGDAPVQSTAFDFTFFRDR
jgi:hypothetical protein